MSIDEENSLEHRHSIGTYDHQTGAADIKTFGLSIASRQRGRKGEIPMIDRICY